ncbi:phospholipase C/P1 nuclease domain-containing protein [Syncephalis plumigaleata]|nr:phospholipase C/P1 nuclease domain-containing protein [Syncephalis plumigaleata]
MRISTYTAVATLFVATTAPFTNAWGDKAHVVIGRLIQQLLPDNTKLYMNKLLALADGTVDDYGNAAAWADNIPPSQFPPGYTKGFHYVSVDSLPNKCKLYDEQQHCLGDKCIVTGLKKYTSGFTCDLGNIANKQAIRFIMHFLGDLHQPLHVSANNRGGTEIKHQWKGKSLPLHYIWDTAMPNEVIEEDVNMYVKQLAKQIKEGEYRFYVNQWNMCFASNPQNPEACVVPWVNEISKYNCDSFWPTYERLKRSGDFSGNYYSTNKEQIPKFIARAAVRAAKYITLLLQKCVVPSP